MHSVAAKAVAFHEAMSPTFAEYAKRIVTNAKALADTLMESGWRLVSGGTDNHLMLIDLTSRAEDLTGHQAAIWLAGAGLVANKNLIPYDSRPPTVTSGIRLGTAAVTTRGMGTDQMKQVGKLIDTVLTSGGDETVIKNVHKQVLDLCRQYPIPSDGNNSSS